MNTYKQVAVMSVKNISYFLVICLSLCGCAKKEDNVIDEKMGTVFGLVTDYTTGEPVRDANVSLQPGEETSLTGYDGMYSFTIPEGDYHISVSRAEYSDLLDEAVINVKAGKRIRRDLRIRRTQSGLRITDVNGVDISELDFGDNAYTTVKSFNIFNNGTVGIACSLVYSCNWISHVSSVPNTISPGQTVNVSVEIDRSKLAAGANTTNLYVSSNNGNNMLRIRATGQEVLPQVVTLPVTNTDGEQDAFMHTFHANVVVAGNPAYTKRGFCWSSTNMEPTTDHYYSVEVDGDGIGEYSYTWWDYPIPSGPVTYYVRAWVMREDGIPIYGNTVSYVFMDV